MLTELRHLKCLANFHREKQCWQLTKNSRVRRLLFDCLPRSLVFVRILVCNGESNLGGVSTLARGPYSQGVFPASLFPTLFPLGTLDTRPRLRDPLQIKIAQRPSDLSTKSSTSTNF